MNQNVDHHKNSEIDLAALAAEYRNKELFFRNTFVPTVQAARMLTPFRYANTTSILGRLRGPASVIEMSQYRQALEILIGDVLDALNLFATKIFMTSETLTTQHEAAVLGLLEKIGTVLNTATASKSVPMLSADKAKSLIKPALEAVHLVIGYLPQARTTWLAANSERYESDNRAITRKSWKHLVDNSPVDALRRTKKVTQDAINLFAPKIYAGSHVGKGNQDRLWKEFFQVELQRSQGVVRASVPTELEITVLEDDKFVLNLQYTPHKLVCQLTAEDKKTKRFQELSKSLHFNRTCTLTELQDAIREVTKWYESVSSDSLDYTKHIVAIREEREVMSLRTRMTSTFSRDELKKVLPALIKELNLAQ